MLISPDSYLKALVIESGESVRDQWHLLNTFQAFAHNLHH